MLVWSKSFFVRLECGQLTTQTSHRQRHGGLEMSEGEHDKQQASEALPHVLERFIAAHDAYQRLAREAAVIYHNRLYEVYNEYLRAVEAVRGQAPDTVQQGLEIALHHYLEATKAALTDANRTAEQAYRAYVEQLQQAWVHVDVHRLDVMSLACIEQSMVAVTNRACGALPIF
jgi:hypothetical protein